MKLLNPLIIFYMTFRIVSGSPSPEYLPSQYSVATKKSGCIKVNRCKCIMRDGSGVIDLVPLGDSEGFLARLKPVSSDDAPVNTEVLVSFNPCQPFSEPDDFAGTDCTDVASCLIVRYRKNKRYISRYLNYGRHVGNEFHYNDSTKTLSVSYWVYSNTEPHTVVHYHCSPNSSVSYSQTFLGDVPLQIWVENPCVCPNACALADVGPGTIVLILLCLSATAYFIFGSCALRSFRTSSGVQIAPEDSVWCMLCYLFTDRPASKRKRHYSLRDDTL